jgi:hypothetical protein
MNFRREWADVVLLGLSFIIPQIHVVAQNAPGEGAQHIP